MTCGALVMVLVGALAPELGGPAAATGVTAPAPVSTAAPATPAAASATSPAPAATTSAPAAASAPSDATSPAIPPGVAPPPDPTRGERTDGRTEREPPRNWRWVPRILLFPLRAIFWLIELPTVPALRNEDKHHSLSRFISWLSWNDNQRGIRPALYYTTVYIPEFGLRYFDKLTLGPDSRLTLAATTGGAHYVSAVASAEPTRVHGPVGVIFDIDFDRRYDLIYNGIGYHTSSSNPFSRYAMNSLESRIALRLRPLPWLAFYVSGAAGFRRFLNGDRIDGQPGIIYRYDTSTIPGFDDGTTFVRAGGGMLIDLRDDYLRPSRGVVIQAGADYTHGIDNDVSSYGRFRGSVGVPINLWARTHVLVLQAYTALAWQSGPTPIPFSELPTLGGPNDLRGFHFQNFRDSSSFYVSAEYRWPAWVWVDGALFVDYGGVFGTNYAGFGTRRMQPDIGVALRLLGGPEFNIRVQFAYGFGEGFAFSFAADGP